MAETYTKKNGRLVNSRGEWVWNGESYEYVISHSDWLPLVFKSKADSDAFELLEKIWKAEQIVKNSHNQQEVTLAKEWLRKHSARHSDMSNVVYYVNGDVLQHWGKGKEAKNHKYKSREYKNGRWVYDYETKISEILGINQIGFNKKKKLEESEKELKNKQEQLDAQDKFISERAQHRNYINEKLIDPNNKEDKEDLKRQKALDDEYIRTAYINREHIADNVKQAELKYTMDKLMYDKTLLGKVEKGMSIINKLFKQN